MVELLDVGLYFRLSSGPSLKVVKCCLSGVPLRTAGSAEEKQGRCL